MLRNVVEGYISRVSERELDLPFLLLLPAMGFYDVHYTHGKLEFGKDFIAKREEDGRIIQYVFQTKAGDISLPDWRTGISGQMNDMLFNALHPRIDNNLFKKAVLVTTGKLTEHALAAFKEYKEGIARSTQNLSVELWLGSNLVDRFEKYGLTGIHQATSQNFAEQSRFFMRYSQALDGTLTIRNIEAYSRYWTKPTSDLSKRLLWASIEAEVIAQQCVERGRLYEALYTQLALLRVVSALVYMEPAEFVRPLYERTQYTVASLSKRWVDQFRSEWDREHGLVWMMRGTFPFLAYPVQCARIIEATALAYFTGNESERDDLARFLAEFVQNEPGSAHPVGGYYAVHLVLATAILCNHGKSELAKALINDTVVWVCDRHTEGFGLAGFEDDEVEETRQLLGYPFEPIEVERNPESLIGSVCCDLAAFIGDPQFYADVVNDLKSCELVFPYWQSSDTVGSCFIESKDIIGYSNVIYSDEWTPFTMFGWAEHASGEADTFQVAQLFGMSAPVAMMVLLRDRFFLKLWPQLSPCHDISLPSSIAQ